MAHRAGRIDRFSSIRGATLGAARVHPRRNARISHRARIRVGVRRDGRGSQGRAWFARERRVFPGRWRRSRMLAVAWYFKGQPSYRADDVPARAGPSVAVLPFANMSGKPEEEYFSDGMTEELLNVLARVPKLKVAARTSVFEFKGKGGDVREIGQQARRESHRRGQRAARGRAGARHRTARARRRRLPRLVGELRSRAQGRVRVAGRHRPAHRRAARDDAGRRRRGRRPRAAIDPLAYDEYLKGRTLYRQRKDLPEAIAHLQARGDACAGVRGGLGLAVARTRGRTLVHDAGAARDAR